MVLPDESEVPCQRATILARPSVKLRCDLRPHGFAQRGILRVPMTRFINISSNAITQSTSRDHIGEIVLVSREARDAYSTGDSICRDLNRARIFVFVGDDRGDRPHLCAVTGGKRIAAVKELTTFDSGQWPRSLGNSFQRAAHDHAVDQCFGAQNARLSRSIIVALAAQQIESRRHSPEAVNRTSMTYGAA